MPGKGPLSPIQADLAHVMDMGGSPLATQSSLPTLFRSLSAVAGRCLYSISGSLLLAVYSQLWCVLRHSMPAQYIYAARFHVPPLLISNHQTHSHKRSHQAHPSHSDICTSITSYLHTPPSSTITPFLHHQPPATITMPRVPSAARPAHRRGPYPPPSAGKLAHLLAAPGDDRVHSRPVH